MGSKPTDLATSDEIRAWLADVSVDEPSALPRRSHPVYIAPTDANDHGAAIENVARLAESPIEAALGTAIVRQSCTARLSPLANIAIVDGWMFSAQSEIDCYRVDFELSSLDGVCLILEADGHEFHDRTKQQAASDRARDRWMIGRGYRVLRFAGSEIHGRAEGCAREVHRIMHAVGGRR